MTTELDNIGGAIVNGVCNPEAKEIVVDLGELGLGMLFNEGILKEIPIIKTVIACRKSWAAIHDQLFLQKVARFLAACPPFTDSEKETFIREHLRDSKKAKDLREAIVLILDKLDGMEKPALLAKAFAAFVRGKIPHECFRRLASAIDIGFIEDLKVLAYSPNAHWFPYLPNLVRTNLVNFEAHPDYGNNPDGEVRIGFNISPLGEIFVKSIKDSC
jgi:hypothetical protein